MHRLLVGATELGEGVVGRVRKLAKHPVVVKIYAIVAIPFRALANVPEKWRRWIAAGVSVSLHALALLFLLWPHPSGLNGSGIGGEAVGEGEGFGIDLVSVAEQRYEAMTAKELEAEDIEEMKVSAPPETMQLVESDLSLSQVKVEDFTTTTSVVTLQEADSGGPSAASAGGQGQGGSRSDDGLWDAIAPCWRRLADKDTLPVKMTVSFGAEGMLSVSPVFERNKYENPTEQIIRSETLAVMALVECGSYKMSSGRQAVAIDFPAVSGN